MNNKRMLWILVILVVITSFTIIYTNPDILNLDTQSGYTTINTNAPPPSTPVRLIFIHHSVGENWLSDDNGGLGTVLKDNNYFVSDTNYGWGPDSIGDKTDIGQWWLWFRGPDSKKYLDALYAGDGQSSAYSRMSSNPEGENTIIVFKSCFISSALKGNPDDPVPAIDQNPLKGESSESEYHAVANAKGIYIDLLEYFKTRQDKLFVVITIPPSTNPIYANNARAFNQWLVKDWLKNYPYKNVVVFDLYGIWTDGGSTLKYPSGFMDDHPNQAGNQKATEEFIKFINDAYSKWNLNQ